VPKRTRVETSTKIEPVINLGATKGAARWHPVVASASLYIPASKRCCRRTGHRSSPNPCPDLRGVRIRTAPDRLVVDLGRN